MMTRTFVGGETPMQRHLTLEDARMLLSQLSLCMEVDAEVDIVQWKANDQVIAKGSFPTPQEFLYERDIERILNGAVLSARDATTYAEVYIIDDTYAHVFRGDAAYELLRSYAEILHSSVTPSLTKLAQEHAYDRRSKRILNASGALMKRVDMLLQPQAEAQ